MEGKKLNMVLKSKKEWKIQSQKMGGNLKFNFKNLI